MLPLSPIPIRMSQSHYPHILDLHMDNAQLANQMDMFTHLFPLQITGKDDRELQLQYEAIQ